MPKLETLDSICFALEISLAELLFDVDSDKLTGEEIELLSQWKQLNKEQRTAVMSTIKEVCGAICTGVRERPRHERGRTEKDNGIRHAP